MDRVLAYRHSNNELDAKDAKTHALFECMAASMCNRSDPILPCYPKKIAQVPLPGVFLSRMLSNKNTVASLCCLQNLEQSRGTQPY